MFSNLPKEEGKVANLDHGDVEEKRKKLLHWNNISASIIHSTFQEFNDVVTGNITFLKTPPF